MGSRGFGFGGSKPIRSTAVETISDAATADERFGRPAREGRTQARMESIPGADGDFVAATRGAQRMRELRILPRIWLRSRSEEQFAGGHDSRRRENGALRDSAEFLRASYRSRCER